MSFRIIKAEERLASLMTWYAGIQTKVTDFIAGSTVRSKFEALAVEMEAQDYQFYVAVKKAIPTAIYQGFEFELRPAVKASGLVTFTAASGAPGNIPIPKGTQVAVSDSSKIYETSADAMLPTTTVDVPIICTVPGVIGNTGPSTVTVMKSTISGIASVSNGAGLINGMDKETEDERRSRFQEYITTLSRGIIDAVEYGAKQAYLIDANGMITEQVLVSKVVEPYLTDSNAPLGRINCYIYNGATGASSNLIAAAQKIIDGYKDETGQRVPGYKSAGIICTVSAATMTARNVTIAVTALPEVNTVALKSLVESTTITYIQSLKMGESFIYNELIARLKRLDGVDNINITVPTGDVAAADNEIFVPGTVAATVT